VFNRVTLECIAVLALLAAPLAGCGNGDSAGGVSVSDNFNDDRKDPEKWGPDEQLEFSDGVFSETDGVLEMTGSPDWYLDRPWIATLFPYDSDWEVQVDLENAIDLDGSYGQFPSIGLAVFKDGDHDNRLRCELYTDTRFHYRGFYLSTWEDGFGEATHDSHELFGLTTGAVRVRFDSTAKLLTVYYDEDSTDGYEWTTFYVVSIGGDSPADTYLDWSMSDTDRFSVSLFGTGSHITSGLLRADNFETVGGFRP
jgi:hypothetical protein